MSAHDPVGARLADAEALIEERSEALADAWEELAEAERDVEELATSTQLEVLSARRRRLGALTRALRLRNHDDLEENRKQ